MHDRFTALAETVVLPAQRPARVNRSEASQAENAGSIPVIHSGTLLEGATGDFLHIALLTLSLTQALTNQIIDTRNHRFDAKDRVARDVGVRSLDHMSGHVLVLNHPHRVIDVT